MLCDSLHHLGQTLLPDLFSFLSFPIAPRAQNFPGSTKAVLFPSCISVTTFLLQPQGGESGLQGPPLPHSASDVSWCLFGQQHVKANKIRSGWHCDKVSAPMALPGLWQAPGQIFSMTPLGGDWQIASVTKQQGHNQKEMLKEAVRKPPGLLPL